MLFVDKARDLGLSSVARDTARLNLFLLLGDISARFPKECRLSNYTSVSACLLSAQLMHQFNVVALCCNFTLKALYNCSIGLLILLFCSFDCLAQPPHIILGRPTNRSTSASILFSHDADFKIAFGQKPGVYTDTIPPRWARADVPEVVEFSNLKDDTRYFYILLYAPHGSTAFSSTPQYTFHTQRRSGSAFRFLLEADEHLYDKKGIREMYQITLDNEARDSADFMITLGDIFGDDHTPSTTTSDEMKELHKDYVQYLGAVCHSMPFYVCLGNHEGETGYFLKQSPPNNIGVYGTLWRKYYYPNPIPNDFYTGNSAAESYGIDLPANYYSWTWGDALFVVLDVYRHCDVNDKPQNWDWTLGKAQYDWLKNTLAGSTAAHKFVFCHHNRGQGRGGIAVAPGFEWGGYDNGKWKFDTMRPGWDMPIHQLMVKYGVDIFFQGHDHLYAKEELDGVVYQEVPMPSDSTYTIGMLANADAYKDVTLEGTGHLRIDVGPSTASVEFVRAYLPRDTVSGAHHNREIGHSYVVQHRSTEVTDFAFAQTQTIRCQMMGSDLEVRCSDASYRAREVEVYTLHGQLVARDQVFPADLSARLDMSALSNGVYIVQVVDGVNHLVSPILILR